MGIISRFLLLLYTLIVGATVVIIAGACLDIMPANYWQPSLKFILIQPETLIALAVMLVLSLFFMAKVFASTQSSADNHLVVENEILLQQGQSGEVRVSVDAVEHIAARAALAVIGVREAQASVVKSSLTDQIIVKLNIVLGQGYSAPVVSENIVESIDTALMVALQIPNVPVEVTVTDITNAVADRRQRVV